MKSKGLVFVIGLVPVAQHTGHSAKSKGLTFTKRCPEPSHSLHIPFFCSFRLKFWLESEDSNLYVFTHARFKV